MSDETNEVLEGEVEAGSEPKKATGKRVAKTSLVKVRKHRVDNINRNNLAQRLDEFAAEGRVVMAMNISRDIGGTYEVVSYKDEVTNAEIIDMSDGELVFKQVAEDGKITGVRSTLPYLVEQVGTEADFED